MDIKKVIKVVFVRSLPYKVGGQNKYCLIFPLKIFVVFLIFVPFIGYLINLLAGNQITRASLENPIMGLLAAYLSYFYRTPELNPLRIAGLWIEMGIFLVFVPLLLSSFLTKRFPKIGLFITVLGTLTCLVVFYYYYLFWGYLRYCLNTPGCEGMEGIPALIFGFLFSLLLPITIFLWVGLVKFKSTTQ